jgi:hypothetical protein
MCNWCKTWKTIAGTFNLATMISFYFYISDLAWMPEGGNTVVSLLFPKRWNRNTSATNKRIKVKDHLTFHNFSKPPN